MDTSKPLALIVNGGRDFRRSTVMDSVLDRLTDGVDDVTVISGAARGADTLGEKAAQVREWTLERYPADWDRYGKAAGHIRNAQMVKRLLELQTNGHTVMVVSFKEDFDYSLAGGGTEHLVKIAKKAGLTARVVDGEMIEKIRAGGTLPKSW